MLFLLPVLGHDTDIVSESRNTIFSTPTITSASSNKPFVAGALVHGMPKKALERLKAQNPAVNTNLINTTPILNETAINMYIDYIIENNITSRTFLSGKIGLSRHEIYDELVSFLLRPFEMEQSDM